jgi:hypothetical protein
VVLCPKKPIGKFCYKKGVYVLVVGYCATLGHKWNAIGVRKSFINGQVRGSVRRASLIDDA